MSSDDYYTEINLAVMYAACVYDNKWYIGNILEVSKEFGDVFVDFMKTERKCFTWPSKKDQC